MCSIAHTADDDFTNQDRECVVTLSEAKGLSMGKEMLRCAQHDSTDFGRYSALSALAGCSDILIYRPPE